MASILSSDPLLFHHSHDTLTESTTTDTMTHPTPDHNGTISWMEAVQFIRSEQSKLDFVLLMNFGMHYGHLFGERIDLGELEAFRFRIVMDALADVVFPEA